MSETTKTPNGFAYFFFFGSLRSGYWNNGILSRDAVNLGPAITTLPFGLYIGRKGSVPTCVPGEGNTKLTGELWALGRADAANVHRLETGYENAPFEVTRLENGELVNATIFHHKDARACYYMAGGPELIPSGDYSDVIYRDGRRVPPVSAILEGSPKVTRTEASA